MRYMRLIPLRARDGSVRALAVVDDADFEHVSRWRWCLSRGGYPRRGFSVGGGKVRHVALHRELMGEPPAGMVVDHIDRDPLNNRRENLRFVTQAENLQNKRSYRGASSRHRGVSWDSGNGKWRADARLAGRTVYLGLFTDEEAAAEASRSYRLAHMAGAVD